MPDTPEAKIRAHPFRVPDDGAHARRQTASAAYAELWACSNYTFLTGASHPEELVGQAALLGHTAAAIADTNTLAGVVRAHVAAKQSGIPLAVGARVVFNLGPVETAWKDEGLSVLAFASSRDSYARLSRLLTRGKRRAPKGECHLALEDLFEHHEGLLCIALPPSGKVDDRYEAFVRALQATCDGDRLSLALTRGYVHADVDRMERTAALGARVGVPLVATNAVLYHIAERRELQDVLTCVRHGITVQEAGTRLEANAERHLKPAEEMARLFRDYPGAVERSAAVAARAARFSLDEIKYQYPEEVCPPGKTPMQHLRHLTWEGAIERFSKPPEERTIFEPGGAGSAVRKTTRSLIPGDIVRRLEHEFTLIEELDYARYFLTVHDIVRFARERGILCQGRGAAANSAVCYCLGVTSVDPSRIDLLFERFVSKERNEPPDIDIDFEHERREEVIQYIYQKYGRDRAALTAEVITYRGRSAVRDVGKAMGLSLDAVDRMAKTLDWWDRGTVNRERLRELGLSPDDPTIQRVMRLCAELLGFPRHLSQHVGGFVITREPLCDLVPIENAAMEDRTVIEWDKDDIDAMGFLKVDCLGLGMLTCIAKAFALVEGAEKWGRERAEGQRGRGAKSCSVHPRSSRAPGGRVGTRGSASVTEGVHGAEPDHACTPSVELAKPRSTPPPPGAGEEQAGTERSVSSRSAPLPLCPSAPLQLHTIPPEDESVYDMICRADTIGVFQIESRAQMTMLPRLKPRCYYDLVIEVAIVRPGPIQGDMVHPYLRRRNGEEEAVYPSDAVREVLERTLGVPLFQEQAMKLAIVAAGFSAGEADKLRRAMAAWKRKGDQLQKFHDSFVGGMLRNGYEPEFAERCFNQLKGFSEYGFPESHAASFALLVYVSSWLKKHHPAAFAAALINSQPMGFYAPAQIVRDAQEHAVEVRGVDVAWSGWDCALEGAEGQRGRGAEGSGAGGGERVEETCDESARVSRSDRVAAGHGTGDCCVSGHAVHAAGRDVWLDESDAARGDIHPDEYRRGVREAHASGASEGAQDCNGIAVRTPHGVRDQHDAAAHRPGELRAGTAGGSRSVAVGRDPRSRSKGSDGQLGKDAVHSASLSAPLSLCPSAPSPALRLGMRLVKGLSESEARKIEAAVKQHGPFADIVSLWRASGVSVTSLRRLAQADAFQSMGLDRQRALWMVRELRDEELPLFEKGQSEKGQRAEEKGQRGTGAEGQREEVSGIKPASTSSSLPLCPFAPLPLPPIPAPTKTAQDYAATGLSLKPHPVSFLRDSLTRRRIIEARALKDERAWPNGRHVKVAGIVLVRQRPGTASGIVFMTIEDESGIANLIVRPHIFEKHRKAARHAVMILATGKVERQGEVVHVMVSRIDSLDKEMGDLTARSRDFH